MSDPVRIQLSRGRGFNLQAASVDINGRPALKVDRTTRFGNHYSVDQEKYSGRAFWCVGSRGTIIDEFPSKALAVENAVARFKADLTSTGPHNHRFVDRVPTPVDVMKALRGFNLACWCAIGTPRHADVLLEIANGPLCEAI